MPRKAKKHKKTAVWGTQDRRLNWEDFNFLENLIAFCVLPDRTVPPESGVVFRITPTQEDNCFVALFKIDRETDPLIPQQAGVKRPDYMAFYVRNGQCICTIIEMKGRDEKKLKKGIEQIRQLRDRLRPEIKAHLPNRFKLRFQGILLTPPNAQLPLKILQKQADMPILPLQYPKKFELFPYISKINRQTDRYHHSPRRSGKFSLLEEIFSKYALPARKNDPFLEKCKEKVRHKRGIYLNYSHPTINESYAALSADNQNTVIAVKEASGDLANQLKSELRRIGIHGGFIFESIHDTKD